jgi:hypothetical protein
MKKVAIVHDWLVSMRGGEKVVEALCGLYPDAQLFTLVRDGSLSPAIERMPVTASFIDRLPLGKSHYQYYLPLFPAAVSRFDLRDFDLVISSSSCAAKGVRVRPGAVHVCYCHTPMRYIWDQYDDYARRWSPAVRRNRRSGARRWDVGSWPGGFIANSKTSGTDPWITPGLVVIYPVDVENPLAPAGANTTIVSALVPQATDLAVEAYSIRRSARHRRGGSRKTLGDGTAIEFAGRARRNWLGTPMQALIFPGQEDWDVPVEAMACGKPVVAFAKGGALETVSDGTTGVLFREQTVEARGRRASTLADPAVAAARFRL